MSDQDSCGNCRFWHPSWRFKKHGRTGAEQTPTDLAQRSEPLQRKQSDRGLCRRYAPVPSALTTVWMETRMWDWCGDHERLRLCVEQPADTGLTARGEAPVPVPPLRSV